jgi:hypothetical protein
VAELQRAGDAPKLCDHRHYPYRALTVRRAELARAGGAGREAHGVPAAAAPQHRELLLSRGMSIIIILAGRCLKLSASKHSMCPEQRCTARPPPLRACGGECPASQEPTSSTATHAAAQRPGIPVRLEGDERSLLLLQQPRTRERRLLGPGA